MILIIGLGNPGKKYANTRHNAGFMVIDELEKEKPADFILAKTDTFMNESGKSVKSLIRLNYPMVELRWVSDNLVVAHDDIDLPLGEFKIQKDRGAAGHKGVQSVIRKKRGLAILSYYDIKSKGEIELTPFSTYFPIHTGCVLRSRTKDSGTNLRNSRAPRQGASIGALNQEKQKRARTNPAP